MTQSEAKRVTDKAHGKRLRRWLPWVAGTVTLVLAALVITFSTGTQAGEASQARPVDGSDITYGAADAPTVLIEYSDFECQFCAGYAEILAVLREQYGNNTLFVFRFFPLENHRYGMISAQAAYAAHLQGQFWQMHDLLYQNQEEWASSSDPTTYFQAYAQTLGLDVNQFRIDMNADTTVDFITAQKAEGKAAGVTHTPWFIIDGVVETPRNLQDFQELLDETP